MPYIPITPQTDDRRAKQGATPMALTNCMVERSPEAARRGSGYFITTAPGRTLKATLQASCRGLFSEPGVRDGKLYAPASVYFNEVSSNFGYSSVGAITGTNVVQMVPFRTEVALLSNGLIYRWTGSAFQATTDGDVPASATNLASVAYRLVAVNSTGDGFDWCVAGTFDSWDSAGTASDIYLPDPIVGQARISDDLWSFNSRSTQIWQPTSGTEAEAFAPVPGATIAVGLAARDAFAPLSQGAMFLGHDRRVYRVSGGGIVPVVNRDLEIALRDLTAANITADARAYTYQIGAKEYWGLSCGLERGFVYDVELGLWHERTRYGVAVYDVDFATSAFDSSDVVVAGIASTALWKLDPTVYDDADGIILRTMTIHVPVSGDAPLDRLVIDMEVFDQPLSGQGSAPTLMLEVSKDNGNTWSDERTVSLPANGTWGKRIQAYRFGYFRSEYGMLVRLRISDPIGFAVYGVYVNPTHNEIP